ncbi:hypothetical protein RI367_004123 [Sorochytrium milnesiophthora]
MSLLRLAIITAVLLLWLGKSAVAQSVTCSATQLCPNNLCCNAQGWCTSTADACSAAAGCQSQCRTIPSPASVCNATSTAVTAQSLGSSALQAQQKLQMEQLQAVTEPYFGKSLTIDPIVDAVRDANCTYRYELQPCELLEIMGGPDECPYCMYYYEHIKEATQMFDLDCPIRLASFLGQIRHETMNLQRLWQPIDNGAGAIHIIPANFHLVIKGVPRLLNDFSKEFPQLSPDLPGIAGNLVQQIDIAAFLMRPEHAFLTAGWWYVQGASTVLSQNGCEDLRIPADVGLGEQSDIPIIVSGVPRMPTSGFFEVARCIFGDGPDPGLAQREQYYVEARNVTDGFKPQPHPPGTPDDKRSSDSNGNNNGGSNGNSDNGVFGPHSQTVTIILSTVGGVFAFVFLVSAWQRHKRDVKHVANRLSVVLSQAGNNDDDFAEQGHATRSFKGPMDLHRESMMSQVQNTRPLSAADLKRRSELYPAVPLPVLDGNVPPSPTVAVAPAEMSSDAIEATPADTSVSMNRPDMANAATEEYNTVGNMDSLYRTSTATVHIPTLHRIVYQPVEAYNPRASMAASSMYMDPNAAFQPMYPPLPMHLQQIQLQQQYQYQQQQQQQQQHPYPVAAGANTVEYPPPARLSRLSFVSASPPDSPYGPSSTGLP